MSTAYQIMALVFTMLLFSSFALFYEFFHRLFGPFCVIAEILMASIATSLVAFTDNWPGDENV